MPALSLLSLQSEGSKRKEAAKSSEARRSPKQSLPKALQRRGARAWKTRGAELLLSLLLFAPRASIHSLLQSL